VTRIRRPDDEETSVYNVAEFPPVPQAAPPVAQPAAVPPAAMPPLQPVYRPLAVVPGTSGRVVLAGIVLMVFGIAEALGGAVGAVIANSLRRVFIDLLRNLGMRGVADNAASVTSLLAGIFVTMLLLGILQIVASVGVLSHRSWGRWLGLLLSVVGIAIGAWLVYRVAQGATPRPSDYFAPVALQISYLITLLALLFPADHFRGTGRR
jgi:hypothetical protein